MLGAFLKEKYLIMMIGMIITKEIEVDQISINHLPKFRIHFQNKF